MVQSGKNALITGASGGIGYALARCFAENGYNLVMVARSQADLDEAAQEIKSQYKVGITTLAVDLFRETAAKELYSQVKEKNIQVDVLINNAGQGEWGNFWETDLDRQLDIIQLNVCSLVSLSHFYLKEMVERNEGKIMNVASIAGTTPTPLTAVYGGTKAFVISFSEALYNELKDKNVTITALLPGATETEWWDKANARDTKAGSGEKATPEAVAKVAYDALMKGEDKVIEGLMNKVQVMSSNVFPDQVSAQKMHDLMSKAKK
jgi:short-subunit dehydrogenase